MATACRTATAASSSSSPDWLSLAKWCAGCAAPTQQSDYSKGQRKQPAGRRRCRRCMDAKTELKSFAKRIGVKLASLLKQMDTDKDGKIKREEFDAFFRKILK